ncbi:MAG TPA: D-alanine--D-alanine ligase [Clostridiales bacterium]|nr:D-alanine--D-alanine ligase [Clostridiales bacterium]
MKINLAVFFGGRSVEHEISVISAVQAMHAANHEKYNVIPIYITKAGEMYTGEVLFDINNYKDLNALLENCQAAQIAKQENEVVLITRGKGLFKSSKTTPIHMAFPVVHGTNCEDGSIQGFFELIGLPYIGCDVTSSAIGMDKSVFKSVMQSYNLPVLPGFTFDSRSFVLQKDEIIGKIAEQFSFPVIVKPANLGSSVGISKANDPQQLEEAITLAANFAEKILVEPAITNLREINCSVLGDNEEYEASVCEEPIMKDEILSYKDKYLSGNSTKGMESLSRKLPADLPDEKSEEIKQLAINVFKAIGGSGLARIDFLLDTADNDKVYVNEINTIPGSLAFYLWKESGLPFDKLIDKLVDLGYKRSRRKANLMYSIETNILATSNFGIKGNKLKG